MVLLSKKSDSHISVNIEFGEGEGRISLKEAEKQAEARKPKEKVTWTAFNVTFEKYRLHGIIFEQ